MNWYTTKNCPENGKRYFKFNYYKFTYLNITPFKRNSQKDLVKDEKMNKINIYSNILCIVMLIRTL